MKSADFTRWRKALGLKQKEAAEALGLKKRVIQYYEKGDREGRRITIPRSVALACYAIARGVTRYDASEFAEPAVSEVPLKDGRAQAVDKP